MSNNFVFYYTALTKYILSEISTLKWEIMFKTVALSELIIGWAEFFRRSSRINFNEFTKEIYKWNSL
jgi:hypothetical protein